MTTELILIRHGETDWNKKSLIQGQTDIELNQTGYHQAELLGACLKKIDFNYDLIYSSDLSRARATASTTFGNKTDVIESSALREIDFGNWEGDNFNEIESKYPDLYLNWQKNPAIYNPPGGENLTQFSQRVGDYLTEIIEKNQEQKLIVVTHGGVVKIALSIFLKVDLKRFWQFEVDNTSVTIIKFYEKTPILSKLNLILARPAQNLN
ncbi:alpha-ribazole phosphatase [Halanaerobium salsuginis]|jgi:alpha-ribazole phosphatase|uniref:Alpha-ribazole phosphatase n=1 Tax=Halanaerobium salsuginis TaxID=29563 RepID=A0A1I4K5F0_9FIRM|nr:alpha-ribazole phosphatase [Halanaerobium salsuginis]SFL74015.1 probable phosphoglycerate mutase [Halanaerobium salsuginis]